jgi:hypothetical protein
MSSPQPTIEIIVSPTGQTRLETKGFAGAACRSASAFLEEALGQRQCERLTSEFFAQASQQQQLQEGLQ